MPLILFLRNLCMPHVFWALARQKVWMSNLTVLRVLQTQGTSSKGQTPQRPLSRASCMAEGFLLVTAVGSLAVTAAIQAKVKGVYSGLEGSQELADISERSWTATSRGSNSSLPFCKPCGMEQSRQSWTLTKTTWILCLRVNGCCWSACSASLQRSLRSDDLVLLFLFGSDAGKVHRGAFCPRLLHNIVPNGFVQFSTHSLKRCKSETQTLLVQETGCC